MFMRVLTASALTIVLMTSALAGGGGHGGHGGSGGHGPGGGGHSAGHGHGDGHGMGGVGSRGDHNEGAGTDPNYNYYYGNQNYMGYGRVGPCAPYENC
ncbi:hypothetical protein [Pseudaminobacter soli (ex Li et al. 2025)]|uniref:hypothetical protein n=1 Tax=Pseudaminobacter soli (ex Li et al. 2025) TaxID=1295366 RepID=UPI0015E791E6|nr:hypothetical protein [Mesorhizobium soli]